MLSLVYIFISIDKYTLNGKIYHRSLILYKFCMETSSAAYMLKRIQTQELVKKKLNLDPPPIMFDFV